MPKCIIAILFLVIASTASSQSRFGIKAGPNIYFLKSENDKTRDYQSSKLGFTFGFTYEMFITPHFSVQPELNYSNQRAKETYYGSTIKVGYMQVPVLLKYLIHNTAFSLYAGPQLGFLTSANSKLNSVTTDLSDEINKTDFGIAYGVGYVKPAGGLSFDIRVFSGSPNVIKDEFVGGIKTNNLLIGATVGYVFGGKK